MKHRFVTWLLELAVLVVAVMAITGVSHAGDTAAPAPGEATPTEVMSKVKAAALLLAQRGEAGLGVIRAADSGFVWKDTYVFVVNCEADRVLANPAFPDREGGDIKQHTDFAGKRYGPELCATAAKPGGGWFEYVWPKPGAAKPQRKVSFVMSVPGRPFQLGAGIYNESLSLAELARFSQRLK